MNASIIGALGLLAVLALPVNAHEGHDHGDAPKPLINAGNLPQRLGDGSLFLPKLSQRQMGVLTLPVNAAAVPKTIELAGTVVPDPQRGGRVQTLQAGRIEPAAKGGMPLPGQPVRQGEVLAWVAPALGQVERTSQLGLLAELKAAQSLAERRLARLRALSGTVPGKEIEAAESELVSVQGRLAAASEGAHGREALKAPVSGVLAASHVVAGQVVDARELVFEIVDPDSVFIEAVAYDSLDVATVRSASVASDAGSQPLRLIGASRRLRAQALPLLFGARAKGAGWRLPLGQPVKIQVALTSTVSGLPLPKSAVVRSPANLDMVWVKLAPEHFVPRPVSTAALDGERVLVVRGLAAGERVVVDGAALINQIR